MRLPLPTGILPALSVPLPLSLSLLPELAADRSNIPDHLPGTVYAGLPGTWSAGYSKINFTSASWSCSAKWTIPPSNRNLPTTSLPSPLFSCADTTDVGQLNTVENARRTTSATGNRRDMLDGFSTRSRKYKLNPHPSDQVPIIKQWIGVSRRVYNLGLSALQTGDVPLNRRSAVVLRSMFVTTIPVDEPWHALVPFDIRDEAIRDLIKAADIVVAAGGSVQDLKFRSKKQGVASIGMRVQAFNDDLNHKRRRIAGETSSSCFYRRSKSIRVYNTYIRDPIPTYERIPVIERDCRLSYSRTGEFHLYVPYDKQVSAETYPRWIDPSPLSCRGQPGSGDNQDDPGDVPIAPSLISLDPGVRTFATGYDPLTPAVFKFGDGDFSRICRLSIWQDKLKSKISHETDKKKRWRMRRAFLRGNERMRDIIDSFHWALADYLTVNYDIIMLPWFNSKGMSQRLNRRIRTKTVRSMLSWRHSTFRMKLACKAEERGCALLFVSEAYTTKTCTECGTIKVVGGSKVYSCNVCGCVVDRDVGGGRNILLRNAAIAP